MTHVSHTLLYMYVIKSAIRALTIIEYSLSILPYMYVWPPLGFFVAALNQLQICLGFRNVSVFVIRVYYTEVKIMTFCL